MNFVRRDSKVIFSLGLNCVRSVTRPVKTVKTIVANALKTSIKSTVRIAGLLFAVAVLLKILAGRLFMDLRRDYSTWRLTKKPGSGSRNR